MTSRTWPVLIFGFGSLVLLIALAGLGASRRARQIQDEIITIYSVDRETGRIFRKIDSDIQLSGVLVRDYLLDPSHLTADLHRRRLIEIRAGMAKQLQALDKVIGKEELSALAQLRQKVDAYWDSLDPIFEWTPQQKMAYSALFLRQQVLPKRDAVFARLRLGRLSHRHARAPLLGLRPAGEDLDASPQDRARSLRQARPLCRLHAAQ